MAENPTRVSAPDLPVSFEANLGQSDSAVEFIAHGQNGDLLLARGEAWLTVLENPGDDAPRRLRLSFVGANTRIKAEGLEPLPGKANYLLGNNPQAWLTDVPTFGRVQYRDLYPGVDLVYYGNQQKLEYDLVVQPGAQLDHIVLQFAGADKMNLEANGDLLLWIGTKSFRHHKPVVYQESGGARKILSGDYVLRSSMQVGLQISNYDRTKPLIIDPVLAYSTTFGGSGTSQGLGVTLDGQNNVYVTGFTTSTDFPIFNPFQTNKLGSRSAYVVKFDTNGAVVYATYLGGGVLNDQTTTSTSGQGIAVDGTGHAFVAGYTTATNFPVKNPYQSTKAALSFGGRNAFVTELNPAGNGLVYSTYLGGTNNDTATGIALDTNNDALVTGYTSSTNFPTVNAAQSVYGGNGDGFVTKFSPDGSTLIYSTFLGGTSYENTDLSSSGNAAPFGAVTVDLTGNAYVTGQTYSTNFPVLNAFQPTNGTSFYGSYGAAFVTKLNPAGNLVYSTYFGGRQGDFGRAIGLDFSNNVYIAGNSSHGLLPITNAFQPAFGGSGPNGIGDGFVAAFDITGTNLIYCTYLGGSGDDQINGIAVRFDGALAVTGFTESQDFPLLNAIQVTGHQGLFKSANGAAAWNLSNTGLSSGVIYAIQVDPSNPLKVYALTANGCFKSTDSGATWTAASNGLGLISPSLYGSTSSLMAIDPAHPATLYVAGYSGVYKTTDGADNWNLASAGIPSFPNVQAVAVDPTMPTTLYATTYFNGIFKSSDAAVTWTTVTNGLNTLNFDSVVVDPNNSSNVYAGGGAFSFSRSLFASTNGGGKWNLLGGTPSGAVNLLAVENSQPTKIYMAAGNSSYPPGSSPSLNVSTNGGQSWSALLHGASLSFTALAIAPPAKPSLTLGSSNVISWPASFGGYALQFTPSLNPASWQKVTQPPAISNGNNMVVVTNPGTQGYYSLILTNPASASQATLYLGTDQASSQGVLKSTDGGINWNTTGPAGDTINTLAVNPVNPATIYAGLNGGRDGFVTALTSDGQLASSTYLGGSGADQGNAITGDFFDVFVAGVSASSDFPTTSVSKSVLQKSILKPKIITSVSASNSGQSTTTHFQHTYNCPKSFTARTQIWHTSQGDATTLCVVGTGVYGESQAPPGLHTVHSDFANPYNVLELDGQPTTPGTYNIVVTFYDSVCTWTQTYPITVVSP